jgi:hypothetical protein
MEEMLARCSQSLGVHCPLPPSPSLPLPPWPAP